jgi:hypothetical protein
MKQAWNLTNNDSLWATLLNKKYSQLDPTTDYKSTPTRWKHLHNAINIVQQHTNPDGSWKWNPSTSITIKSAWYAYRSHQPSLDWGKNIWASHIPSKISIFLWQI